MSKTRDEERTVTMIKVKKNEGAPESKEILAEAIVKIGAAAEALAKSGINRRAIVVLLHWETKVPMRDITSILDGLNRLKGWYCR